MAFPDLGDLCQICREPFGDTMIDGATIAGPWANMCKKCHKVNGTGLGLGRGQKYKLRNGKWEKVKS